MDPTTAPKTRRKKYKRMVTDEDVHSYRLPFGHTLMVVLLCIGLIAFILYALQ